MRNWLINLRKNKKMVQEEVARLAFINRSYYSQIESGTRDPSIQTAVTIAKILSFNPVCFFDEFISEPLSETLQESPVSLAHFDLDLNCTWAYNHLGLSNQSKELAQFYDELYIFHDTKELIEMKRDVIRAGISLQKTLHFLVLNKLVPHTVFIKPLKDKKGSTIGVASIIMDIGELDMTLKRSVPCTPSQ